MQRIDGPDAVAEKPDIKPPASDPGYFQGGDPKTGKSATMVTAAWLNAIQNEIAHVIEEADIALDRDKDDQLLMAIKALTQATITLNSSSFGVPVGTVIQYYGSVAPVGYFICNGGMFNATGYPKLYAVLGKNTVPDLRGMFIRGTGGKAAALGARQEDAGRNLKASFTLLVYAMDIADNNGFLTIVGSPRPAINSGVYASSHRYIFVASKAWGQDHTAEEFRPANASLLMCIKHD
jgi:hypothetical protein